jgi:magnesium chelatase family protein
MLAQRLPGILPVMDPLAALEMAARFERNGQTLKGGNAPPFRAPHHHATVAALLGSALGPAGELALADGGVLFLDELPEFGRLALEALREPLKAVGYRYRGPGTRFAIAPAVSWLRQ